MNFALTEPSKSRVRSLVFNILNNTILSLKGALTHRLQCQITYKIQKAELLEAPYYVIFPVIWGFGKKLCIEFVLQ